MNGISHMLRTEGICKPSVVMLYNHFRVLQLMQGDPGRLEQAGPV